VADSGGYGIEHVERGQHQRAFKTDTGSLLGNILAMERPTSTDELLAHIANQTGISSKFL
jgi:hypothetical protein